MSPPVALFCCVSFFFGKVTHVIQKTKKWEEVSQAFNSTQEGLQDELRERVGMFTHSFSFLIRSTHRGLGVLKKRVFLGKQSFRQVIPKGLALCMGFSLSANVEGPDSWFFSYPYA